MYLSVYTHSDCREISNEVRHPNYSVFVALNLKDCSVEQSHHFT